MSATNQPETVSFTTIDLVRHGKSEGVGTFCGSTDVALLPEGLDQLSQTLLNQSQCQWKIVVSSPLRRCLESAKQVSEVFDIPLHIEQRWREIHFGDWEGQSVKDIFSAYPEQANMYYTQPDKFTPPGGEPVIEARNRVIAAFNELLHSYRGKHLLAIQHGGTIRLLLTHILNMPLSRATRFTIPYGCLTRIRVHHETDGDFPVLVSHNPNSVEC